MAPLQRTTRTDDPNDPTAEGTATTTSHDFQGLVERREIRRQDTLVTETVPILTVLGASVVPAIEPRVNDQATIGGQTYELMRLIRSDPAGATYEF